MLKVYLASPLGFSESGLTFLRDKLLPVFLDLGIEVHDPWRAIRNQPWDSVVEGFSELDEQGNARIARLNAEGIKESDLVVAVLDGTDVDSGTASEIGFAYANGKTVFGYLGDVRVSKDNAAALINIQVEWFIHASGGTIVTSLKGLKKTLRDYLRHRGSVSQTSVAGTRTRIS